MIFFVVIFTTLLLLIHSVLIEKYRYWFLQLQPFELYNITEPQIKFSVIIPARNEEENIEQCLLSVLHQHYPRHLFEVIVADDFSTDGTAEILFRLQQQYDNLHIIQLSKILTEKNLNSFKKKAIDIAIQKASGEYIVTTDADCILPENWLQSYNAYITTTKFVFVAAPVCFSDNGSFVSKFQCLDFLSLQGITAAAVSAGFHSMCNGANLAYSKQAYTAVGGFNGIDNIASGDDMMLMHKIYKRYKQGVGYLFSNQAVVYTQPMKTWTEFFNQRIRWASKANKFDDKRIIVVLALVYLLNLSFFLLPVAAIWFKILWIWWVIMFFIKYTIELRFMKPVAAFYKQQNLLSWFPVMQPFHVFYTVIAGWLGVFGSYKWKGRKVK